MTIKEQLRQWRSMRDFCSFVRHEAELACEHGLGKVASSHAFHHNDVARSYNQIRPFWSRPIAEIEIGRELIPANVPAETETDLEPAMA